MIECSLCSLKLVRVKCPWWTFLLTILRNLKKNHFWKFGRFSNDDKSGFLTLLCYVPRCISMKSSTRIHLFRAQLHRPSVVFRKWASEVLQRQFKFAIFVKEDFSLVVAECVNGYFFLCGKIRSRVAFVTIIRIDSHREESRDLSSFHYSTMMFISISRSSLDRRSCIQRSLPDIFTWHFKLR